MMNSVFSSLSLRRLKSIQILVSCMHFAMVSMHESWGAVVPCLDWNAMYICLSSAKNWASRWFSSQMSAKGELNNVKSNGPSTLPWGTPKFVVTRLDVTLSRFGSPIATCWTLLCRYDDIQFNANPVMLNFFWSHSLSLVWLTRLKAALWSSRVRHTTCLLSIALRMSVLIFSRQVSVL